MAIINCPECGQKISSVAAMCPHCGLARGELSEEQVVEFKRRKLRDRVYHLNMLSYAMISIFLAAFGWYWWDTEGFQREASAGPVYLLGLGMLAYVAVRILLMQARRQLRLLARR
ncbi:MAG: hypothetical protein GTN86_12800 [Xanthomonadales bacterium]|nr:hypothetical protein [Xanthomonadales bacterium]NIN60642.1 hypothetical protein [Xanthomonadales bacterium]NIN75994.1 hypothetical protein [Xanthomonadales bacterium]NIO13047.1 hypothetical protein [Xanthomonadales bacterium]NIP13035.1 hypothetical protein [Xanthomonadales bacterium]